MEFFKGLMIGGAISCLMWTGVYFLIVSGGDQPRNSELAEKNEPEQSTLDDIKLDPFWDSFETSRLLKDIDI